MAEKPTMEETQAQVGTEQPVAAGTDIQALVSELESLSIKTPEDVRGIATAAQQAGRLANLLGEANQRIASMEQQVASLRSAPPVQPHGQFDPSTMQEGQSVDLGNYIKSKTKEAIGEWANELGRAQQQTNQRLQYDMQKIQNHPKFQVVKDEFDILMRDPNVGQQVYNGAISMTDVFAEAISRKLDKVATGTLGVLKKFGKVPGDLVPPHMEGGANRSVPGPTQSGEKRDALRKAEKEWTGGNEDIEKALNIVLNMK